MRDCWDISASQRPTAQNIVEQLHRILDKLQPNTYVEPDRPAEDA